MSQEDLHPFPGKWQWWGSYDGGEHMLVGPAASRDAIIKCIKDDRLGEYKAEDGTWRIKALIGEYQENTQDLASWFEAERFVEDAAERMEDNNCGADDTGERHPVDEITPEQMADLESCVRASIRAWQKRNGLKMRSYWFKDSRNEECIDVPHPNPPR